jgi:hypothetical protein
LVTPVPLSPLLLLCCAYGGGSIEISLQAMPYNEKRLHSQRKAGRGGGWEGFVTFVFMIHRAIQLRWATPSSQTKTGQQWYYRNPT